MKRTVHYEKMPVTIYDSSEELGQAVAHDLTALLCATIAAQDEVSVILATGNSQLAFLRALCVEPGIAWNRVRVFQMDEYLGISPDHPASFRRFHRVHLVDTVHPKAFYGIEGDAPDIEAEMARYAALLKEHKPVAAVLGIGENAHLAFNDPPVEFNTSETIQVVWLDEACRREQVGE